MNNQEAMLLLQAYRPNGQDADDPRFTEALEHARRDPALGQWAAEQQEFDRAVSERLRSLPVPANLKEDILASQVLVKPSVWNHVGAWLTLAASIALAAAVALNWRRDVAPADFAAYRNEIIEEAAKATPHVQHRDTDIARLAKALTEDGAPEPAKLPPGLKGLSPTGCRVLEWQGHKVGMVCYLHAGKELHLLVVSRRGFQGLPAAERPTVARAGIWTTAYWSSDETIYLLAGKTSPADLQKYL